MYMRIYTLYNGLYNIPCTCNKHISLHIHTGSARMGATLQRTKVPLRECTCNLTQSPGPESLQEHRTRVQIQIDDMGPKQERREGCTCLWGGTPSSIACASTEHRSEHSPLAWSMPKQNTNTPCAHQVSVCVCVCCRGGERPGLYVRQKRKQRVLMYTHQHGKMDPEM